MLLILYYLCFNVVFVTGEGENHAMWMSNLVHSHIVFRIGFYCFYSHVRSWNAGSSLKLVQTHLTGGQENLSVGDQSQAVCSRTVLEKQASIKKPRPHAPSSSSKPASVIRKVPVGESRNEEAKPTECPIVTVPLKGKAVQFDCHVSNDNPEQRIPVSEGNTSLTSLFWTFSVMLFDYWLRRIRFGGEQCH